MSPDLGEAAVTYLARRIRDLPVLLVRILCIIDLALFFVPWWGWFGYRRWTGRRIGAREFRPLYAQGARFVVKHLRNSGGETGPFALSWFSHTVRKAPLPERLDFPARGSCGTCRNCCTTHWLPEAERETCSFLGERGCNAYGGVWWDYFNCGRYPADFHLTSVYDCRRFGITPAEYFERPAPEPREGRVEPRTPVPAA
jgi:hypothetical protein